MKRTRWTMRLLGGLMLTAAAGGGCKQQLVMEPGDYQTTLAAAGAAGRVEASPYTPIEPLPLPPGTAPASILDPSLPARYLTLKEAVAIALESGYTGNSALNPGNQSDALPQFTGRGTTGTDSLRTFAVEPAIAAAEVERSLSKFDARLISSMTWNRNDQPIFSQFQQSFSNGDSATLSTALAKPLPTGGVAGITFSTQYQNLANPPANAGQILPTSYTPRLQFVFEQPLLQAFGVEINQLTANHPGSFLIPGFRTTGQGTEGILITRLRADQQRAQFDQYVNQMLLNVETAYWNLYASYFALASQEEGLKQALDAYLFFLARNIGGIARPQLVFQNESQYHQFRTQVVNARATVLARERALRNLLGLRSDAGDRLVPVDEPTVAPFRADDRALYAEGRLYRPELLIIRQEVKARQLDLLAQRNLRRPDLRFISSYDVAGIGPRLDGANISDNALRSFGANDFNSWQVGLRLEMPLGFRDANAITRQADLNLKRVVIQMRDAEYKMDEVITDRKRRTEQNYALIETNRAGRRASEQFILLDEEIRKSGAGGIGNDAASFVANLLVARQQLATQTANEFQAIADYNVSLAQLEYEKGTIQRYNNVSVNEGPLPAHVQKKAADHFAARQEAIKLREQPADTRPYEPGMLPRTTGLPETVFPSRVDGLPGLPVPPPSSTGTSLPAPTTAPVTPAPSPTPAAPPVPLTPMAPANPVSVAPPLSDSGLPIIPPAAGGRSQLVPADAPGTFNWTGNVTLPVRTSSGPAVPDAAPPPAAPFPPR